LTTKKFTLFPLGGMSFEDRWSCDCCGNTGDLCSCWCAGCDQLNRDCRYSCGMYNVGGDSDSNYSCDCCPWPECRCLCGDCDWFISTFCCDGVDCPHLYCPTCRFEWIHPNAQNEIIKIKVGLRMLGGLPPMPLCRCDCFTCCKRYCNCTLCIVCGYSRDCAVDLPCTFVYCGQVENFAFTMMMKSEHTCLLCEKDRYS